MPLEFPRMFQNTASWLPPRAKKTETHMSVSSAPFRLDPENTPARLIYSKSSACPGAGIQKAKRRFHSLILLLPLAPEEVRNPPAYLCVPMFTREAVEVWLTPMRGGPFAPPRAHAAPFLVGVDLSDPWGFECRVSWGIYFPYM